MEITDALRSGTNQIEIIVYNTAANALAADEHIRRLAAESEARYGRRFRLQDLDQAMDTVRSGLLQPPSSGARAASPSQHLGQEGPGLVLQGRVEDVAARVEGPAVTRRTGMPAA